MADEVGILRSLLRHALQERTKDAATTTLLVRELEARCKVEDLVVVRSTEKGTAYLQHRTTPLPAGRVILLYLARSASAEIPVFGKPVTLRGGDLRFELLLRIAKTLPPYARRHAHHDSDAAQMAENLLAGAMRTPVRMPVSLGASARPVAAVAGGKAAGPEGVKVITAAEVRDRWPVLAKGTSS